MCNDYRLTVDVAERHAVAYNLQLLSEVGCCGAVQLALAKITDDDQRLSERPNRSSIRDCRNSSPIESSQ